MTLRKKSRTWLSQDAVDDNKEDLLVFGYSCKLFRDDEKAAYIDRGKHLIPWMGNDNHMIDRYDGRGHLHDLEQYETPVGRDPWDNVSDEESYMEKACDEERYMFLSKDLTDQELYHEEEIKRLRAALGDDGTYNQVGFSYDEQGQLENGLEGLGQPTRSNEIDDKDEEFIPAPELNVPEGMEVPSTSKINVIVEKTAMFVSKQGPQMEIVIKAKQANNPQFAFMAFDHPLNPYYKHMVQAIKNGKFTPTARITNSHENSDDDDDGDHYLHPSLLASRPADDGVLFVPKVNYIRTGEDSYSKLVLQLKDKVMLDSMANPPGPPPLPPHIPAAAAIPPPPGIAPVTLPRVPAYAASVQVGSKGESLLLPPADLLAIIDKMALYVAKNGKDFEVIVQNKGGDQRFEFIQPGNAYYPYYQHKRLTYEAELRLDRLEAEALSQAAEDEDDSVPGKESKAAAVVSFSIKMVSKDTGDRHKDFVQGSHRDFVPAKSEDEDSVDRVEVEIPEKRESTADETVTESQEMRTKAVVHEAKQAEQRFKDKLAAAARERLGQVSREKQLQMERKRKAAAFLTLMHREDDNLIGPRLPTASEMECLVNGDGDLPLMPPTLTTTITTISAAHTRTQAPANKEAGVVAAAVKSDGPARGGESSPITLRGDSDMSSAASSASSSPPPVHLGSFSRSSLMAASRNRTSSRRSVERSRSRSPRKHSGATKRRSVSRERVKRRRSRGRKRKKRSRSRSHSRHRSSSHSPVSRKSERREKRKGSRTPPAAYALNRNSASPKRSKESSRSKPKSHKKSRSSRSPSRHKDDRHRSKRSSSPHKKKR